MKKTLTVNLNGKVYHIDEDAYQLLDTYIRNLKKCFGQDESAREIVTDIESRIAEIFSEALPTDASVVSIEQVKDVITRIGEPEEVSGTNAEEEAGDQEQPKRASVNIPPLQFDMSKRLYRSLTDRMLGGVAGGIAAYLGVDSVWVRLALIVSALLFFGTSFVFYIVMWLIVPQADTVVEELRMKGETVSVSNIGKAVTNTLADRAQEIKSNSIFTDVLNAIFKVATICMKVLLIFFGICLLPVLFGVAVAGFGLFMVAVGIVAAIPAFVYELFPYIHWEEIQQVPIPSFFIALCGIIVLGIPVLIVIRLLISLFKPLKRMRAGSKIALLLTWILAIVVGLIFCISFDYHRDKYIDEYIDRETRIEKTGQVIEGRWTEDGEFVETEIVKDSLTKDSLVRDGVK
ncbi:MAG: PspC domain-containing protein [Phocaeicola sp.]|nr:PspC domain-containing protein [Phocaeicola sp.]MDY5938935.1 PspC domain-containing protein [Phocaeicola sp.]